MRIERNQTLLGNPRTPVAEPRPDLAPKQPSQLLVALFLLLIALGVVLNKNRDFWFGANETLESDPADSESVSKTNSVPAQPVQTPIANVAAPKKQLARKPSTPATATVRPNTVRPNNGSAASNSTVIAANRTVLPPLEVEVVAGDSHRIVRPGNNSVRVDLQPGSPPQTTADAPATADTPTAAGLSNAAERVQLSADASAIVTSPVRPNYPLLARQMKVQGSVILQALIGRDGVIQNLRVVSGPHILASAAQDAVRQWHFKPHLEGDEAVETQAKITVNFTISTN